MDEQTKREILVALTASEPSHLLLQYSLLMAQTFAWIYFLLWRAGDQNALVLSHSRLWLSVSVTCAACLGAYRLAMLAHAGSIGLWWMPKVLVILLLASPAVRFLAFVVDGGQSVKDLQRPLGGPFDYNWSLIPRCALFSLNQTVFLVLAYVQSVAKVSPQ